MAAAAAVAPQVDYRRHVAPLLNRLGCNAAACHGASEGQGGFRLSLFGYDLKADHAALVSGREAPRANWRDPKSSLLLLKPTAEIEHGGGELFPPDGWEERVLKAWVAQRAPGLPLGQERLDVERLEVRPTELRFAEAGERQRLRVIAHWNDGRSEEVTRLVRFVPTDAAIADVAEGGEVVARRPGAAHIVAYYDRAIAPIEVLTPYPTSAGPFSTEPPSTDPPASAIDAAIARRLSALRLSPAPFCDDATFLRRVTLDLTGRLPEPDAIGEFVNDRDPNKRARLVDELLRSDAYSDYWAAWFCRLWGLNEASAPGGPFAKERTLGAFAWVRARIDEGLPYDQLAKRVVEGTGRAPDQSFDEYAEQMAQLVGESGEAGYADLPNLPEYWGRSNTPQAAQKTLAFSHALLAVRLQCAECHKHPFDRWTKDDFDGLTAFFERVRYGTPPSDKARSDELRESLAVGDRPVNDGDIAAAVKAGKLAPWSEVYLEPRRSVLGLEAAPRPDPLHLLGDWLTADGGTRLAAALANRVWEHHLGAGIVSTSDDLSVGIPPSNRELLDALVADFQANGYDLRELHRSITHSAAYQRSLEGGENADALRREFACANFRRLPAESLFDAVLQASAEPHETLEPQRMSGRQSVLRQSNPQRSTLAPLGQGEGRAVCQRESSTAVTPLFALTLYNGPQVRALLSRPGGWITSLAEAEPGNSEELVKDAYLRTLGRQPSCEELNACVAAIEASPSVQAGVEDVLWALINTGEFAFQH